MGFWSDNFPYSYCENCQHSCHCDQEFCNKTVGIGMTDKWDYCRCPECKCQKKVEKNT